VSADPSGPNLSPRASAIKELLQDRTLRRVSQRDLWRLLDQVDPATRADARRRHLLHEVLAELSAAKVVLLPSHASYDTSEDPPIPQFVTLPAPPAEPKPPVRRVVWHPALAWAAETRLLPRQRTDLELINNWLHMHRDDLVVPLQERSIEVFGHEKALDRLLGTNLFGPGRLTLDLLYARRVAPPLTVEKVGEGNLLLVAENSATFDSLLRALSVAKRHRISMVGWGAGAGFEASVASISRLRPRITRVLYFGDVDEKGLRIPANAATLAAAEGLPPISPALGLYTALIDLARPQGGQRKLSRSVAEELSEWLAPEHRNKVNHLLITGNRLAQEAVGLTHLLKTDEWTQDLR
jgi:hypothetical protein